MHDITDKRRSVKTSEERERVALDQLFDMMQNRKQELHDDMPVAVLEQRPAPRVKLRSDRPKSLPREKLLPKQSRKKKGRRQADLFVMFPLLVCQHSPVRDARTANEMHLMTTYEFGALAGVLCVAVRAYDQQRREQALAVGGKAANRERQHGHHHLERWKRKMGPWKQYREHDYFRPQLNKGTSVKRVAQMEYRREKKRIRPDDVITVQTSRYDILRSAGVSTDARNLKQVPEALDRLQQWVGPLVSPLFNWEEGEDGQLRLEVRGKWLEPPFVIVPLPPPLRSSVATSLYLWGWSIAGTRTPRLFQKIKLERLCELIGISTLLGRAYARRALKHAVKVLNKGLGKLRSDELAKLRKPITVPVRYKIEFLKDDYVRLVAGKQEDEACS
jgi:translation initiation factor IF-1